MKKEEKVKSINKKIIIIDALIAVFAIALVGAVLGFVKQELIATAATVAYEEAKEEVIEGEHESVNFSVVQSKGSTATSWLYIPGTNIDYPLVQGPNNDYYLNIDAYGNSSTAGAIFINFANAPDMSDAKTVIFGHNMSDGSMFTDLHKYASEDFGKVHQDAYIYMQSGAVKHYKLRYYLFTQPLNPTIYVVSKADVAMEECEKIKDESDIVYSEATGNNIICLSTCTAHKYRTVVVFEYVDDAKPIVGSLKMQEETKEVEADAINEEEAADIDDEGSSSQDVSSESLEDENNESTESTSKDLQDD